MQEAYPVIAKVPTHILTWGKWIEESLGDHKEVVICITGNPGLPGFYTKFFSTVYECLNKEMPVWVIGHAGHDEAEESSYKKPLPPLKNNEQLYHLEGQLQHKVQFIRKYVPENVKIHLIGHSIGCYLALELLKIPDISARIQHCYFLFPTIERMVESKNGFILTKVVNPVYFFVQWFYRCFALLPNFIKVWIIYAYFLVSGIPKYYLGTALKYTHPPVIDKIWHMALDEMEKVRELDIDTVRNNKHRIRLYYGATDGWVPVKYYHELKEKIPDIDAEICTRKFEHAFVLHSAAKMGFMVGEWILKHKVI
ncbi:lipid droplet-associated hydrolase [Uranotaenia lowii]|uniref:lipid droplet-associated hydrolase n=1 Tax=Uranotaenia lowii TaxID=190385 RepID=UPI00247AA491|nr:lipid droplet-associated hydrolase [Uranotaenia lowii]XP_055603511.1 lipid droplet-associated hydrolase [Uranotaenia lowii]